MRFGKLGSGALRAVAATNMLSSVLSPALAAIRHIQPDGHHMGRTRYSKGYARRSFFDPRINRNNGRPHLHRREIARRTTKPGTEQRRIAMKNASTPS